MSLKSSNLLCIYNIAALISAKKMIQEWGQNLLAAYIHLRKSHGFGNGCEDKGHDQNDSNDGRFRARSESKSFINFLFKNSSFLVSATFTI